MPKHLPRAGAYYDVSTGMPVRIVEHGPHCEHPTSTWFSFMDRRSDDMAVFKGKCCTSCGRIIGEAVKRV